MSRRPTTHVAVGKDCLGKPFLERDRSGRKFTLFGTSDARCMCLICQSEYSFTATPVLDLALDLPRRSEMCLVCCQSTMTCICDVASESLKTELMQGVVVSDQSLCCL